MKQEDKQQKQLEPLENPFMVYSPQSKEQKEKNSQGIREMKEYQMRAREYEKEWLRQQQKNKEQS